MGHREVHLQAENKSKQTVSTAVQPPRSSGNSFLKSWAWKREHRPDRDRFELPYKHKLIIDGKQSILSIQQRPFKTTGFASTVWDSAIVLSKYIERSPTLVAGKRCLELGAGCGLPGIVSATLGAKTVVLTDLPDNLPLLRNNAAANHVAHIVSVESLVWGSQPAHLDAPYDIVIATDVMYIVEALGPLIKTMKYLSEPKTKVLLAYGRNRQAEDMFVAKIAPHFVMERVADSDLDDLYQCVDVDVYQLQLKR
ncbi:unnamed protein product [Calypogeia fissa]